jgi:hypothetical protein
MNKHSVVLAVVTTVGVLAAATALAQPELHFDPVEIDVPMSLRTGGTYAEDLVITNEGDEILDVALYKQDKCQWFWFDQAEVTILPRESASISVNFAALSDPCMDGIYNNAIVIRSNDPKHPMALVPVKMYVIASQVMFSLQNEINFGAVLPSELPAYETVRLMNAGCQFPLTISGITITSEYPVFSLPIMKFPIVVQPGEVFQFNCCFSPPTHYPYMYAGTMTVASDDPAHPEVAIPMVGWFVGGNGLSMSSHSGAAVKQSTWGAIKSLFH